MGSRPWKVWDRDTILQDFEKRYMPEPNSGCWLWIGQSGTTAPYGIQHVEGQRKRATHVSWWLITGEWPRYPEQIICHHCDTPPCVNPDHLFIGTIADNNRDMVQKGRLNTCFKPGHTMSRTIATPAVLRRMKAMRAQGATYRELAQEFGFSDKSCAWGALNK